MVSSSRQEGEGCESDTLIEPAKLGSSLTKDMSPNQIAIKDVDVRGGGGGGDGGGGGGGDGT